MKKYQTMTEMATQVIREGILKGVYLPGAKLKPTQMEQDLDLGRVAIREALKELVGSGLVESIPNKGIQVAMPPSFDEVMVIFESRFVLEGNLAFQAAKNATQGAIEKLQHLHQKMEAKEASAGDRFLLNREFHLALYEDSGWFHTCRIAGQMLDQILTYYSFQMKGVEIDLDFRPHNQEHQGIIQALIAKDPQQVRDITVANIRRGCMVIQTVSDRIGRAGGIDRAVGY